MLGSKCKELETTRFFPPWYQGVDAPPNPRWSTHTRILPPCPTKKQVFTKNAPSPTSEWRASHHVQSSLLGAPTNSKSSPRTSRSPRPSNTKSNKLSNLHLTHTNLARSSITLATLKWMISSCLDQLSSSRSSSHGSNTLLLCFWVASDI